MIPPWTWCMPGPLAAKSSMCNGMPTMNWYIYNHAVYTFLNYIHQNVYNHVVYAFLYSTTTKDNMTDFYHAKTLIYMYYSKEKTLID